MRNKKRYIIAVTAVVASIAFSPLATVPAAAQPNDPEQRLRLLEAALEDLLKRDAEKDELIRRMRQELAALRAGDRTPPQGVEHGEEAHDHAHGEAAHDHAHAERGPDLYAIELGGGVARLRSFTVSTSFAAGFSSEQEDELETLQAGDHDPRVNGFTLRAVDFAAAGSFDPWFDAFGTVGFHLDPDGETVVELEEAFLQTQSLPAGLQARAGLFYTEFGLHNRSHPHDWTWLDQPVVNNRFFGPDGARAPGVRLAWSPFAGLRLLGGAQNAKGETMASFLANDELFEERPVGGLAFVDRDVNDVDELVWLARLEGAVPLPGEASLRLGASALFGPNAAGLDGETRIWGADLLLAAGRFSLQAEAMRRDYDAEADPASGFDGEALEDWGGYVQALYGFHPQWSAGLRYEYVSGSGESVGALAGREADPFRADRSRTSPLLTWRFAPTARLTLQYNYDRADHLEDDDAHAVWLGLDWTIGAGGPAHAH
jgi:hypothetical protein